MNIKKAINGIGRTLKKRARVIINILIFVSMLVCIYFLYLSITPEGYTGRIGWFEYDVHNQRNPAIVLAVLVAALVAVNWRPIMEHRNKIRLVVMALGAVFIMVTVFFFLGYKRHNRFPWDRPNIVIIVVDTLRADHVSAYHKNGPPGNYDFYAYTPNMDSLAAEGWLFENAYTHIPITMPSHSSLFSGRLPHKVWVTTNGQPFQYKKPTLAEIFKEEDYKTGAVISLGVLKSKFNLDRGFDYYYDKFPKNGQPYNRAEVVTREGANWLEQNVSKDDRFFLWLHYSDPHEPYSPPDAPDDTEISLNGQTIKKGCLASSEFIEVELDLKPNSNNALTIEQIDTDGIQQLYFTSIHFSDLEDEDLPEEWLDELKSFQKRSERNRVLRDLQEKHFLSIFEKFDKINGLEIGNTGSSWRRDPKASRPRLILQGQSAGINIKVTANQPRKLTLRLKGGANKTTARVWEDYRRETEYTDYWIGEFLQYLKDKELMNNTIVVLISDHGEELNEHGIIGHIHHLYTQSMQIPLIIRDPNSGQRGVRINRFARIIDVAPTILDMAGLHKPQYMEGKTLMEYVLHNRFDERRLISETFRGRTSDNAHLGAWEDKIGIQEDNWLFVYNPEADPLCRFELYDLHEDRIQWRNLVLSSSPVPLNMFAEQAENLYGTIGLSEDQPDGWDADEEDRDMWSDLGYVAGPSAAEQEDSADRPAPSSDFLSKIRAKILEFKGDLTVENYEPREIGEGGHYLFVDLTIPENDCEARMMALQDHIKLTVSKQLGPYPLHVRVTAGEDLIYEKVWIRR